MLPFSFAGQAIFPRNFLRVAFGSHPLDHNRLSNDASIRVRCAVIATAIAIIAEATLSLRMKKSSDGRREARPGERGAPRCNTFIMISCHYLKYKVKEGEREKAKKREIETRDEAGARGRERMREAGRDQEK